MGNKLDLLVSQFELHTRLYNNVVEDLEEVKNNRLNDYTNHAAWLAGHIVSARYLIGNLLGVADQEPHPETFGQGKGIDMELDYPLIATDEKEFNEISPKVLEAFKNFPEEKLEEKAPIPAPTGDSIGALITFLLHHEAYHIGQLGILRKYFGKEAMKYE